MVVLVLWQIVIFVGHFWLTEHPLHICILHPGKEYVVFAFVLYPCVLVFVLCTCICSVCFELYYDPAAAVEAPTSLNVYFCSLLYHKLEQLMVASSVFKQSHLSERVTTTHSTVSVSITSKWPNVWKNKCSEQLTAINFFFENEGK